MRRHADDIGPDVSIISARIQIIKTGKINAENYGPYHDEGAYRAADNTHTDTVCGWRSTLVTC